MIVATASANINPLSNPFEDVKIDLATDPIGSLLPQNVYADAVDPADPTPAWDWQWYVVSSARGGETLVDATQANAQVKLTEWGNVLLFVVATNTNTGQTSETDPYKAPTQSFVKIRMFGAASGVEIFAAGERDYWFAQSKWADEIERLAENTTILNLADLLDVNTTTGAQLDRLADGSYAVDGLLGVSPMHRHRGSHVDAATDALVGVSKLAFAPVDVASPRVLNRQKITLTGSVETYLNSAGNWALGVARPDQTLAPNVRDECLLWRVPAWILQVGVSGQCYVERWSISMNDGGGPAGGVKTYQFALRAGNTADAEANNLAVVPNSSTLSGLPSVDRGPLILNEDLGPNSPVAPGDWIGIRIQGEPDVLGHGLTASVTIVMRY